MTHIKTCKAIRMNVDTENSLNSVLALLQSIHRELDTIVKEDDYFEGLEYDCQMACDYLEEFINSFKSYAKGEDN